MTAIERRAAIRQTIRKEEDRLLADPMLTLAALAAKWRVTTRFLWEEERRGRLKVIRLSTRVCRIRASEVARYEAERESETAA